MKKTKQAVQMTEGKFGVGLDFKFCPALNFEKREGREYSVTVDRCQPVAHLGDPAIPGAVGSRGKPPNVPM